MANVEHEAGILPVCRNCGAVLDPGADACSLCGATDGDPGRPCPDCREALAPGAGACPRCGTAVAPAAPVAAAEAASAAAPDRRTPDAPVAPGETAEPGELGLRAPASAPDYGIPVRLLSCGGCGNRLAADAAAAAPEGCPLCGATSLEEIEEAASGPIRAAPFAVPPARATAVFHRWLKRQYLRPAPWVALARSRGLRGVYLPLWTVEATLRSRWSAEIARGPAPVPTDNGAGAVGPRRKWEPVEGERVDRISRSWPAISVAAESPALASLHDHGGLVPWAPEYLAGWTAVIPRGGPDEAWREVREVLFERARERVEADLAGAEHRALRVETAVEVADVAASLVPVYVAAVPWRGRVYRTVVDGRTGRVEGEAPYSPGKLGALVGAAVLAVAAMGATLVHEEPPSRPAATQPAANS